MRRSDKKTEDTPCQELSNSCPCDNITSADEKIYNILNTAEKLAVKAAKINKIRKKAVKKRKKKDKKLCKINKKTGALILKKERKQKVQKPMKRYKAKKKG